MDFLTIEDLLEVSMFRCKICCRRLQCPIMQVGISGNICGACYERSAFTDVTPNADVETLLAKLNVSCNYKERGCTYDGCYYTTCEHEKNCEYRDKICPFSYVGQCDIVSEKFYDIPAHISSYHQTNILVGKINYPIQVPNPTETNHDLYYLLILSGKKFLLRAWIDSKAICYTFYCFKNDIALRNIKISLSMKWKNTMFSVSNEKIHVQPESEIGYTKSENFFSIPVATFQSLDCLENVSITINTNDECAEPTVLVKTISMKELSVFFNCSVCSKRETTIFGCPICKVRICLKCRPDFLGHACDFISWVYFNISDWELMNDIRCQNEGCNQVLQHYEYLQHEDNCLFKKQSCLFRIQAQCYWQGYLENLAAHMNDTHSSLVNQNECSLETSKDLYFVRGDIVFKLSLDLSSDGNLSITTQIFNAHKTISSYYKWNIRIISKQSLMAMLLTEPTVKGGKRTINVENYISNKELTLYVNIKRTTYYFDCAF